MGCARGRFPSRNRSRPHGPTHGSAHTLSQGAFGPKSAPVPVVAHALWSHKLVAPLCLAACLLGSPEARAAETTRSGPSPQSPNLPRLLLDVRRSPEAADCPDAATLASSVNTRLGRRAILVADTGANASTCATALGPGSAAAGSCPAVRLDVHRTSEGCEAALQTLGGVGGYRQIRHPEPICAGLDDALSLALLLLLDGVAQGSPQLVAAPSAEAPPRDNAPAQAELQLSASSSGPTTSGGAIALGGLVLGGVLRHARPGVHGELRYRWAPGWSVGVGVLCATVLKAFAIGSVVGVSTVVATAPLRTPSSSDTPRARTALVQRATGHREVAQAAAAKAESIPAKPLSLPTVGRTGPAPAADRLPPVPIGVPSLGHIDGGGNSHPSSISGGGITVVPLADWTLHSTASPSPVRSAEAPSNSRAGQLRLEAAVLAEARSALRQRAPEEALRMVHHLEAQFTDGLLVQERETVAIEALFALGRGESARGRAEAFLRATPQSAYAPQLRRMLQQ